MNRTIAILLIILSALTSCNTHKHIETTEQRATLSLDSTLLLKYLASHLDIEGVISIDHAPVLPNFADTCCVSSPARSSGRTNISFNIHATKRDTLQESSFEKHCTESTQTNEVEQLTESDTKVSSWWLKMRYRALLCILLLCLPFVFVGIYRIYRVYKRN